MESIAGLLAEGREALTNVSPSAVLDAEVLLAAALEKNRTYLYTWPEHQPAEEQCRTFRAWLARRQAGEPVAYLTCRREFFGHEFVVSNSTLIPRPDTEVLVEAVLERFDASPLDVLDLGTGTGAIAISLALARPHWRVLATDVLADALSLAEDNVKRLRADAVTLRQSRWFAQLEGRFDLIVSNPPYVRDDDPHLARGDVRFEPRLALAAGTDGLDCVREIVEQAPAFLKARGWLVLEHGYDQGADVRSLMNRAGFTAVETRRDLADIDRVTLGSWRQPE